MNSKGIDQVISRWGGKLNEADPLMVNKQGVGFCVDSELRFIGDFGNYPV